MENSGHSFTEGYSEGNEPIKLTDRVEQVLNALEMTDDGYIHYSVILPTIKRYEDQLKEERNRAIDECMAEIERLNDDGVLYESTARKVLESLKLDSK